MKAKKEKITSVSIPVMTEGQLRSVRRLIRTECANYYEGQCLPLDYTGDGTVCPQWISYCLLCGYFRRCVLPLDPELYMSLDRPSNAKVCPRCGKEYVPRSNRSVYCACCSKEIRKSKERERIRKLRENSEKEQ